ncbi:MAG: DUF3568 family protein [Planctomycetes bacterium]|nr:DUF3568 family protein [Planctomycetota bacterium]
MKTSAQRSRNLVLALLAPALAGCVAAATLGVAAVGAAGVVLYAKNEAVMKYQADIDPTWDATMAAMQKFGYQVDATRRPNPTEGKIEADDTVVRVQKIPGNMTQVSVRVGTFRTDDNKRRAKLILEDVQKRLSGN